MTKRRSPKKKKAPARRTESPPRQELTVDRRRVWLRNLPLLIGIFATYIFTAGPIGARAEAGTLTWGTVGSYALVGVMGIAGSLLVYRRYWVSRLAENGGDGSSRAFYLVAEVAIYLLGGVGIGFLLMAAVLIVYLA